MGCTLNQPDSMMVYPIADNILSPLGETTRQNYEAVRRAVSALRCYDHYGNITEPFCASRFTEAQRQSFSVDGLTRFESLAYTSAKQALASTTIDVSRDQVVFILSTTKGNVELMADTATPEASLYPGTAARRIASRLGIPAQPITVCNACISGVAAIILAQRLLSSGRYDYAVVCGADVQSPFTVSGFQSLKAVAHDACKPFDIDRIGLNLGEAAATIILSNRDTTSRGWAIADGAIRNDGFHISSPSNSGDGATLAIQAAMSGCDPNELAFINAHGTATLFNDQMESVAIERAGLQAVPVNALKGYFGHTLGAAGVLETILSMSALDDHTILATRGFSELGVSGKIHLSSRHLSTRKQSFLKMISGFGGGNAAIVLRKNPSGQQAVDPCAYATTHRVTITPQGARLDGKPVTSSSTGLDLLTDLYKRRVGDYPKFYKMDGLSRLGFIATELLMQAEAAAHESPGEGRAIVFVNRTSSVASDCSYQASIVDADNYFPSPSVFVYTLPNIVTGEIAIRHHLHGETSFYILPERDEKAVDMLLQASFQDRQTQSILGGWIDYQDSNHFEAEICIIKK